MSDTLTTAAAHIVDSC